MDADENAFEHYIRPFQNRALPAPLNKVALFDGILSPQECKAVIRLATEYTDVHGWTTKRHKNYPTTDIPTTVSTGGGVRGLQVIS